MTKIIYFLILIIVLVVSPETCYPLFSSIPEPAIHDICLCPGTGVSFLAVEDQRAQSYFISSIGPVPRLEKCKHTTIGTPMAGGISGGEKKRLNVGNELLVNPSVLILDEPTSGLDSKTAKELVELLQEVASEVRTVICSIHQPSSSVFHKFDNVLLLSEGQIIYDGASEDSMNYFSKFGINCPVNYHPADFLLDLSFDDALIKQHDLIGEQKKLQNERKLKMEKQIDLYAPLEESAKKWHTDWQYQFRTLTWRVYKQKKGDVITWIERRRWFFVCLIGCVVWYRIPRKEEHINDYIGCMFFVSVFQTFVISFSALIQFMGEEPIIKRERRTGSYRLSAYYLSKWVAELPIELSYPMMFTITMYWFTGVNDHFSQFMLFIFTLLFQENGEQKQKHQGTQAV